MAEILNQNEIDKLLSEIDPEGARDLSHGEDVKNGEKIDSTKVIRFPKREVPRSYNPYHSPVVKAGLILMDPEGEIESDSGHVVVRTLENYAALRKKRFSTT